MTKEYFEFLLKCPFEFLNSPAVSFGDFRFVLENCNKDINEINFDNYEYSRKK